MYNSHPCVIVLYMADGIKIKYKEKAVLYINVEKNLTNPQFIYCLNYKIAKIPDKMYRVGSPSTIK